MGRWYEAAGVAATMLTDMRLLVQSYLGEPAKGGGRTWWYWHCQVNRPDKRPSLSVSAKGFHCFSCGAKGGPWHFLTLEMGYGSEAADLELGHDRVPRAYRRPRFVRYMVGPSPPMVEWRQVFGRLLARSQAEVRKAEKYLTWRGITMETARHFGLGYNSEWQEMAQFETWLAPGVVIPAYAGGLLWSLEVRVLDEGPLKYHRPKGVSEPVPFGLARLQGRDALVVTEGSFDAMCVWQVAGDELDVLALRGAHNSLRFWEGYLVGYHRVIVATDADRAGDEVAQDLRAAFPSWERRRPPDGMDLNQMLRAGKLSKGWLLA